ncbi:hypothetical protein DYQ86_25785 [Acidobacteria bacterium AB60]|nr:hypothetical protein DYQ86_25785 [Acidobacteria bacterium AB60]
MHTPGCATIKSLLVVGAVALASFPAAAQRISADSLKNGHFPQVIGHLDGHPDKSIHHLPDSSTQSAAKTLAAARPVDPPRPIVSPFMVPSSRSHSYNYGYLVGDNPFSHEAGVSTVKTYLVPLVIKVHQVATDFSTDASGNLIFSGIVDQDATFDPTQPAPACLGSKNNVPFNLAVQSPLFQNHHWVWGGTDLGNTQYIDAFQRANYWNANGDDPGSYGLRLNTKVLPPLVIDFPKGTAIGMPQSSSLLKYSACAPTVLVDFNLFDEYLDYIALPQLASSGVNSGNFPLFIGGNIIWGAVIGQLPYFEGQAAGYHSYSSVDPAQTYGVAAFGDDNFILNWPDAMVLSHEISEWSNDPTTGNAVQAYNTNEYYNLVNDPTGPVSCQGNYETGDELTGFFMPPVTGKNGFQYTLQELPFFSYFYGGPSIGVNGWYSNNNTITGDAGPACSPF